MANRGGGCLCSAVRYELSGRIQMDLSCYCRECQYISGGGPSHTIIMLSKDVRITQGEPKEFWTVSAKGRRVARIFCEKCGTPLFARNERLPQYLAVKVGSLDDPSVFEPQANIWIKSAQPWHHLDAAISRFKENPELGARAILEFFRSSAVKLGRLIRRRGDYGAAGQARAGEPGQGRPAGK
jgi:hypothetical protein